MRTANTNIEAMGAKILQIIPVSGNLKIQAHYKDEGEEFNCPVVCMALIQYIDGSREVVCLDIDNSGVVDVAGTDILYSWV